jgi:AraC-like DNA-binding protein
MTTPRIREGFPGQRLVVVPASILKAARANPVTAWLYPTHLGRFDHARHHHVDRRNGAPDHVLILCLDGAGFVRFGGQRQSMEAGDAVLLPPGQHHAYGADPKAPWTILWFHFAGQGAADHGRALLDGVEGWVFRIGKPEVMAEAFEETFRHVLGAFTGADLFALSTSFARFLGLARLHRESRSGRRREADERILKVIRFLRENISRSIEVETMARVAGWAPSHFSAVFRRQTKASPLAFLNRLRVQTACALLKETDEPIAEIGARVGLTDPFYFSRLFRQLVGMPPRLYRQTYGG